MQPLLVVITGPTAVGKTDLCVQIAKHFNTEIISADSRQFYKELCIGTAKPCTKEMQNIPHHFVGQLSIKDNYNANDFEKDALSLLKKLFEIHNIVILTGGSGLFIDALCDGFDEDLPGSNTELRNKLDVLYKKYGIEILQEKLKQLDPIFYKEVDLSNAKRLFRAIEVCLITGKPFSELRKGQVQNRPFKILKIALSRDREELFDRINQRVDIMINQGLLKEVKSIISYKNHNALKTVGYTELIEHLNNEISLDQAIEKIKTNTRRYAKRQINWFMRNNEYKWYHPSEEKKIIELIQSNIN
ncbi:MAG: tRNA (adenosine(37)-N6)-dimethylallyltransferase MiaA [Vicingaceae bacterium]|nr:tRNA (adenosine(37)-N6)-dimethylallyltransferase MiaA [Vicingaceae bacterium]